jgi:2-polyprenyl-3-methyl-5-hydroxy-6-metoxy-1,4-benzoquinol methylase
MQPHPESDLFRCASCTHAFSVPREHETYDEDYYEVAHERWFKHPNTALFDRVADAIASGSTVLDVGCGKGHFLRHLQARRPDLTLTGIDLSAPEEAVGIQYLRGDIMTVDPGSFDAVVSLAVIEHIPNVSGFVQRLRSVVRPGGGVVTMTVNESSLLYRLAWAARPVTPIAFNRLYSAHHVQHFSRRSLATLLRSHDLRIERSWTHNVPLAAIDIPRDGFTGGILRAGMGGVCAVGAMTRSAYLQTVVARA